MDSSRAAVIDTGHRALVNYEAYYVCGDSAMAAFAAEPYRYTGKVTDPVSLVRFIPTKDSPSRSYGGRLFYFSSSKTAGAFDADREKYGTPMPGMRETAKQARG